MDERINEAAKYLKDRKEYKRILEEIQKKYIKTEKLTGSVKLSNITKEEGLLLASLHHSFIEKDEGKINVKKFIEYFCKGKFEGLDFLEILKVYFKDDLKTSKVIREEKKEIKDEFFNNLRESRKSLHCKQWLDALFEIKKFGYNIVIREYENNPMALIEYIEAVDEAFSYISFSGKETISLAVLSSNVKKNSHYFDMNRVPGKLLLNALAYLNNSGESRYDAEYVNEVLFSNGIVRDELSNSTITVGILAYSREAEIEGLKWFRRNYEPIQLSIYNIKNVLEMKSKKDKVFVFENPVAFYEVMEKTKDSKPTMICTSGQLNVSSLMILDKLVEGGATIYYSGDFDPEGLQIADRLKRRYKDKLLLWGMTKENYLEIKGDVSFEERIIKLSSLGDKDLVELSEVLKEHCTAGYQELLVEFYVQDIESLN